MADEDISIASGESTPGQADGQTEPSGDGGNGAADRSQGTGGEGANPSKTNPPPDNSISDDDETALIAALSSGDMDSIGDDGKPKKPDDKTPAAKEPEAKPEAKADDPAKEPEKEKAKDEPIALSDEDKAAVQQAPKQYRKELTKLFEERHQLRDEIAKTKENVEQLAPVKQFTDAMIKHASEAGLVVSTEDGKIDASGLRDLIEQERMLKGKSSKEIAAYYRGIAEELDPDSVQVEMPQDLKDLVDIGSLKQEEALALARKRDAQAKQPEREKRHQQEAEARKAADATTVQAKAAEAVKVAGYGEIAKVAQGYQTRYGADWKAIGAEVEAKLQPLLADTNPKAWAKLAETVIESVVAARKAPLKKPTNTPPPGGKPPSKGSDVMSEEDERKALAAGTF